MAKHRSRRTTAAFGALAVAVALAGCSGSGESPGGGASGGAEPGPGASGGSAPAQEAAKAAPTEISIMNSFSAAEPPRMDGEMMKAFQEYTNTKLSVTWVPSSAYEDKVNVAMASGELPNMMIPRNFRSPSLINAIRSGGFWEIGPYLSNYPNLNKINKVTYENLSVDGKIYAVPRPRPLARNGLTFRKDWLDNLGLKEPKTLDELYQVLRAFAHDDPDKNGKPDTYGVGESKNLGFFAHLVVWMGGPQNWQQQNGVFTPDFMSKEYMDALNFMKRLYDEKIVNADFAVTQNEQRITLFNQGKAGMFEGVLDDSVTKTAEFNKINPNGKIGLLSRFSGPGGEAVRSSPGYSGGFLFPKSSVKTEAQLFKQLEFLDKSGDEKMQELFAWGVEGKHHKLENGKKVKLDEKAFAEEVNVAGQFQIGDFLSKAVEGEQNPVIIQYQKMMKDNEAIIKTDPTTALVSDTFTEIGSELAKIIDDARVKYIMGKIDAAEFQREVERWKQTGGDKVMAEYAAEYAKTGKK